MIKKSGGSRAAKSDVPYNAKSGRSTREFWKNAFAHTGVAEWRARVGRSRKGSDAA
jgi:hypothetical protein